MNECYFVDSNLTLGPLPHSDCVATVEKERYGHVPVQLPPFVKGKGTWAGYEMQSRRGKVKKNSAFMKPMQPVAFAI
jgi:hypothetical protein